MGGNMVIHIESKYFLMAGMYLIANGFNDVKIARNTTNTIIAEWSAGFVEKNVADVRSIAQKSPGIVKQTWMSGGWSSKELV